MLVQGEGAFKLKDLALLINNELVVSNLIFSSN